MDENYIILRSFKRMEMIFDISLSPFSLTYTGSGFL